MPPENIQAYCYDRGWFFFPPEFCSQPYQNSGHTVQLNKKTLQVRESWRALFAHFLYRILDSKKTSRFKFCVPGLQEIHRNLKQQKKFGCHDGFFRKSPFCTFSCINPGFGGPLDKLLIFFLVAIFIMRQKNAYGQKFF